MLVPLSSRKTDSPWANSIFVSGKDVYVAGYETLNRPVSSFAVYWKDGVETKLTDGKQRHCIFDFCEIGYRPCHYSHAWII